MTAEQPDLLPLVARREALLRAVPAGGARSGELYGRVDVSRPTVDRGMEELASRGLVERTADGYRRTVAGRLALAEYDRFRETLDGILDARGVLEASGPDADVAAAVFEGARIVDTDGAGPAAELADRAEWIRAVAPALDDGLVAAYAERIVAGDLAAEVALPDDGVTQVLSDQRDALAEALDGGCLDLRRLDAPPAYTLALAETPAGPEMALFARHEDGTVRGVVRNDAAGAVDWARDRLGAAWAEADPLPSL